MCLGVQGIVGNVSRVQEMEDVAGALGRVKLNTVHLFT